MKFFESHLGTTTTRTFSPFSKQQKLSFGLQSKAAWKLWAHVKQKSTLQSRSFVLSDWVIISLNSLAFARVSFFYEYITIYNFRLVICRHFFNCFPAWSRFKYGHTMRIYCFEAAPMCSRCCFIFGWLDRYVNLFVWLHGKHHNNFVTIQLFYADHLFAFDMSEWQIIIA